MSDTPAASTANPTRLSLSSLSAATVAGLAVATFAVLLTSYLSYQGLVRRSEAATLITHTQEVITQFKVISNTLQDAETGQRGFLLTNGQERYLEPYNQAVAAFDPAIDKA